MNAKIDIRLPLHLARRWRIEPSVGVQDFQATSTILIGGSPAQRTGFSNRSWRVAVAASRLIQIDSTFNWFVGRRH